MAILLFISDIIGEINGGDDALISIQKSGTRIAFIMASFICFGFFSDQVVGELFSQVIQTEEA